MKKDLINPITLKGREKLDRIKHLMGESVSKENKTYVIELTKKGPDGKVYAIVRENHQYFIKTTDKTENIIAEDLNYIGGLKNKTDWAFNSYSKAIKQLNLKFINLNESLNKKEQINAFLDDNIITETKTVFKDEESMKEELDPVGQEDSDIDNDGEEYDENDLYILNKRMTISNAMDNIEGIDEVIKKKKSR